MFIFFYNVTGKYFPEQSLDNKKYSKNNLKIYIWWTMRFWEVDLGGEAKISEFSILIVPTCKNWAFKNIFQELLL